MQSNPNPLLANPIVRKKALPIDQIQNKQYLVLLYIFSNFLSFKKKKKVSHNRGVYDKTYDKFD